MSILQTISRSASAAKDRLKQGIDLRKVQGRFRSLQSVKGVDFCSNDYLGLARQPLNVSSSHHGSTGSRLISGHSAKTHDLESKIAGFHGFDSALIFGSGYSANSGLLACLGQKNDVVISDEYIHASLIDGIRLSYAKRVRFAHNDVGDLERQLKQAQSAAGQVYVVIESLYSMDGDFAPLVQIARLCEQYNAALIVDEAHSVGIYGEQGRGLVDELGLHDKVLSVVYTFGKAFGLHGAVICGSNFLKDYLVNYCRPFIYSTAPGPHTIEAMSLAYDRVENADQARQDLNEIINYFNKKMSESSLMQDYWVPSQSPIQSFIIPGNSKVKAVAADLQNMNFAIKAILSPTVRKGKERLRISVHSFNTKQDVDGLMNALKTALASDAL